MKGFTLSSGIGRIPNVEKFLGIDVLTRNPVSLLAGQCEAVYSWGSKPYSKHSEKISTLFDLPHLKLEDGFICSFGKSSRPRKYSVVVDSVGIYYDATVASALENILNGYHSSSALMLDDQMIMRAKLLMTRIVDADITKYNYLSRPAKDDLPDNMVLVVDQTEGDQSVRLGGMNQQRFEQMLHEALQHHEASDVVVKVHPDVLNGKKNGYLASLAKSLNVRLLDRDLSSQQLAACRRVYVGTSLMGMEALLRGVPVECFGQPFYAGWGLTQDRLPLARRQQQRTLTELFIAAYLLYPRYVDPISGSRCELEEIVDHLALQFEQRRRIKKRYTCVGITPWKRRYIDRYLQSSDYAHTHVARRELRNAANDEPQSDGLLVWGKKSADSGIEQQLANQSVARMEDGFLRSVGLGSNFTAPRSLVVDDLGIYFDATRPSRLEQMLQNTDLNAQQIARAEALIKTLRDNRVSKYTGSANDESADTRFYADKRVLLVIGQVDGDASLRFGSADINTNLKLIRAVRQANPDSTLVYKPHPDVVSGNRSDGIGDESELSLLCDRVETQLPIQIVMRLCEEIHTMTSLTGLEALLCGKQVVTYGRPFYAGWGLTTDRCEFERRQRKRTLPELVYLSYVQYPAYLDVESGEFTSVEKTISALVQERAESTGSLTATGLEKYVNIVRNIKKGLTYAA